MVGCGPAVAAGGRPQPPHRLAGELGDLLGGEPGGQAGQGPGGPAGFPVHGLEHVAQWVAAVPEGAVAVGNELVIAHPHDQTSVALSLVLFGGPLLYLLSQTAYLWAVLGTRSWPRVAGLTALVVAGGLSHLLPAYLALGLLTALLLILVVVVVRDRDATPSRRPTHRQT